MDPADDEVTRSLFPVLSWPSNGVSLLPSFIGESMINADLYKTLNLIFAVHWSKGSWNMGRPTQLNGWWFDLLIARADGNVGTLAEKLNVHPRQLNRWVKMEDEPRTQSKVIIADIAGDDFLTRDDCPPYLHARSSPSEFTSGEQTQEGGEPFAEDLASDLTLTEDVSEDEMPLAPSEITALSPRKIFTDKGDPEVESLHRQSKKGKLDIQPDFQRQYVWDNKKASRLLESILLDIPLPVIYLSEESDGKTYVIDGQQRLTSLFSFIDGTHPDGRVFKLVSTKVFPELEGKTFQDLPEILQDKISNYKVRTITFLQDSDKNLKYEIFERLNSGSVSLNDQELRNCIFRGPYNDLMKKLSTDPDFKFLIGRKQPHERMLDVELVLRFSSFYHATHIKFRPPMKAFLNRDAEEYRSAKEPKLREIEDAFKNACLIIRTIFGSRAFKRFHRGESSDQNGHWEESRFNASLYDVYMSIFARLDKHKAIQNSGAILEACIDLMTNDNEFINSIELSTSSLQAVTKRFDRFRVAIHAIVEPGTKEPRFFTRKVKEELFHQEPICAICNNRINDIDDAAVDHIKQYWLGGPSTLSNARLAHRYCNWSRPRTD